VRLCPEVVELVRINVTKQVDERDPVVEVPEVQEESPIAGVRVLVDPLETLGVKGGRSPDDPVDLVSVVQQELRQIGPVLTGDAGDQCGFGH